MNGLSVYASFMCISLAESNCKEGLAIYVRGNSERGAQRGAPVYAD